MLLTVLNYTVKRKQTTPFEESIRDLAIIVLSDAFSFHTPQSTPNKLIEGFKLLLHIAKVGCIIIGISASDSIDLFEKGFRTVVAADGHAPDLILHFLQSPGSNNNPFMREMET